MVRIFPILSLFITFAVSAITPESIQKSLMRFKQRNALPGLAAAVYINGEPHFFNIGYSHPRRKIPVTENTSFDIASITKSFTATLLALAVLQGRARLDDQLAKYLPFLRTHPCPASDITLEQLATHTSSLPRQSDIKRSQITKQRVLNWLVSWVPEKPIGTKFLYSNLGYEILGYALENIYSKPYEQIVADYITTPLDMGHTYLRLPPTLKTDHAQGFTKENRRAPQRRLALVASGGLKSSTSDLMKFLMANMGVYGPSELQEAMKLAQKGRFRANPRMVQGLSWQNYTRNGITMIDKNGGLGGFSSWMGWVSKENSPHNEDVGVILLSTRRNSKVTKFGRNLLVKLAQTGWKAADFD